MPVGSAAVCRRGWPAAGPVSSMGVVAVMRRLSRAVAHHLPGAAHLADLDDAAAVGGHLDVDAGRIGVGPTGHVPFWEEPEETAARILAFCG